MKKLTTVFAAMFIVVGIASLVACSSGGSEDSDAGSYKYCHSKAILSS